MSPDPAKSLTPERWQRMEAIFHQALAVPEANRAEVIRRACGDDRDLAAEVESLLLAFEEEKSFSAPQPAPRAEVHLTGILGGYQIDGELGHGGMGTVYLAHRADGQFERQVALKVVSAHLRSESFSDRFRDERQILARLNHPHITRLLDGGVGADGDPYLVMEYVDGSPIDKYCDAQRLTVAGRIGLFLQVCSAVEYAHANLVVHRDLKPGNIFVTQEGVPKLLDFGTAKLLQSATDPSATTRLGMLTPRYASPEQLRGEPIATASDVYSLGVVLYELLTGAWPFGDPRSAVAGFERALRDVEPLRPRSVVGEEAARARGESPAKLVRLLSGDLQSVTGKALEANPRNRYTSVEQMSEDLRRYLDGRPVLAKPQTPLYRGARFVQRNRWRLAAGTVLAAGLGLTAFSALWQYGRNRQRIAQVRELSESYLSDILTEVGRLPGSTKARLLIVDRARHNLDALVHDAPGDRDLRGALAEAYWKLGDIQGRPFGVNLGDSAGALESYRKAAALASQASPRDWKMVAILVRARKTIAQIEARAGQNAEALATIRSILEPARRLWKEAPHNFKVDGHPAAELAVETNLVLGYCLMRLAAATNRTDQQLQTLEQLRRTLAMAEEVQATYPGVADLVGRTSQYLGFAFEGTARRTGDATYLKEAVLAHRRASEAFCRMAEIDANQQTLRNCADSWGEVSWALHNAGEGAQAVAAASESLRRMEPIAQAEPGSQEARSDLANAYFHLGAAENVAGKYEDAIGHFQTAERTMGPPEKAPENDPLEIVKLYVDTQRELAAALLQLHRGAAAAEVLRQTIVAAGKHHTIPGWDIAHLKRQFDDAQATAHGSIK